RWRMCRAGWKALARLMRPQLRPGAPAPGRTCFEIVLRSPIYPIRRADLSFLSLTCYLGLDEFPKKGERFLPTPLGHSSYWVRSGCNMAPNSQDEKLCGIVSGPMRKLTSKRRFKI